MIFDKIENAKKYLGEYPFLNEALTFIATHDLNELPLGKTEINGNDVYVNVMEAETIFDTESQFEIHHCFMDIQMDLEGEETLKVGYGSLENESYDEKSDFGTVKPSLSADFHLKNGYFVALFPGEPHQPTLVVGEKKRVKKCVVKVRI